MALAPQLSPLQGSTGGAAMQFKVRWALALLPVLALATPAIAQVPSTLADPNEPGSVLVFPKFVNNAAVSVDGALLPRTEIELGAVCPVGFGRTPAEIAVNPFVPG